MFDSNDLERAPGNPETNLLQPKMMIFFAADLKNWFHGFEFELNSWSWTKDLVLVNYLSSIYISSKMPPFPNEFF